MEYRQNYQSPEIEEISALAEGLLCTSPFKLPEADWEDEEIKW